MHGLLIAVELEIRTENCSDTCQHNIRFVLTFYQTLVETYAVALNFGSDMCQIKVRIVQVNTKSGGKCQMFDCYVLIFMLCKYTVQ